jgi:hypothetical protein
MAASFPAKATGGGASPPPANLAYYPISIPTFSAGVNHEIDSGAALSDTAP